MAKSVLSLSAMAANDTASGPCLYSVKEEGNLKMTGRMSEVLYVNYAIWRVFFLAAFLLLALYIGFHTYQCFLQLKSKGTSIRQDYRFCLWTTVFVATVLRTLWLLDPHERSVLWPHIYGNGRQNRHAVDFLLKMPQIMCLAAVLMQVKMWRRTVNNAKQMRSKAKNEQTETNIISVLVLILVIVGFSSTTLYSFNVVDLSNLSNGIFALYCLAMCIAGAYYGKNLGHLIHQMIESHAKSQAVRAVQKVQRAVLIMLIASVFLIAGVIWAVFIDVCNAVDQVGENANYLWFITFVHGAEFIGIAALTLTLKRTDGGGSKQKVASDSETYESTLASQSNDETETPSESTATAAPSSPYVVRT